MNNRITMTQARTELGITMKVLRRLLEANEIKVDMAHRNCAQMTVEQYQEIVDVFLAEERSKLKDSQGQVKLLTRISKKNRRILGMLRPAASA